jgi:uncharacterized protein YukE
MTIPATYDAVTLNVVPWDIYNAAQTVDLAVNDVIDALQSIGTTLSHLQLGWVGTSAAEAQSFGDEWTAAMTNLFGSTADPTAGVLSQVVVALYTAAGNYSGAEQGITTMFASLANAIPYSTGASNGPAPAVGPETDTSVTDPTQTAIGFSSWTDYESNPS